MVWYRLADSWALGILDDVGAQVARELRELGFVGSEGSTAPQATESPARDWTGDGEKG
jgi:hypothetical protein